MKLAIEFSNFCSWRNSYKLYCLWFHLDPNLSVRAKQSNFMKRPEQSRNPIKENTKKSPVRGNLSHKEANFLMQAIRFKRENIESILEDICKLSVPTVYDQKKAKQNNLLLNYLD